jgi:hypothetical protein
MKTVIVCVFLCISASFATDPDIWGQTTLYHELEKLFNYTYHAWETVEPIATGMYLTCADCNIDDPVIRCSADCCEQAVRLYDWIEAERITPVIIGLFEATGLGDFKVWEPRIESLYSMCLDVLSDAGRFTVPVKKTHQ